MSKILYFEQALHGYSHGHHLLSTSVQLSKVSQRNMLNLSDLSGPDIYPGFSEYLTGYPLIDDEYYALAKTWYAPEMERLGCVWTHTILIKFDNLNEFTNTKTLLRYFKRPQEVLNIEDYNDPIEHHHLSNNANYLNYNNIMVNELKYLVYSIYNDEKPVILPSESVDEYQKLILLVWQNQWLRLRRNFTFCTGSLANRKLGKKTFDIQIVPYSLSKSIGRSDKEIIVLDDNQMKVSLSRYPEWVLVVADEILHEQSGKFKEFINDFGETFEGKKYFSKFAQLYIESNAKNRIKTIDKYISIAKTIFKRNDSDSVIRNTLEQLFNSFPNKWFRYTDFSSFLQDLSVIQDINRIYLNKLQIKAQLKSLWESNQGSAKELFKGLISKDLNKLGELLLKEISLIIQPEQLSMFTDMDLEACNVLVRLQPKFALCSEIWHQSRNFQHEILDCINKEVLDEALSKKIIEAILENSSEVLYKQVFRVFGEDSIEIFLNWCRKSIPQKEKVKNWINICKCNPEICLKWVSSIKALYTNLLVSVVSVLDPYSATVRQNGLMPWINLFKQLNQKDITENSQLTLAQFFLPLILTSNEIVADDFVKFSFTPIYNKLAKNQFSYERWIMLESILPSVPWYNSWDKCKRLRKAMKEKGYSVQSYVYNW